MKIGFIGLGLIGGSIARAVRYFYPDTEIIAHSRTRASVEQAMADVVTGSTDAEKTVTTDGWWKDFSDYYKLSGNFDVTFTIDNKGGTKNWNNPAFVVTTDADRNAAGYSEYAVVRMDAYGWETCCRNGTYCQ